MGEPNMLIYFEQKTGQFFPVIGGDKYFPINIETVAVTPHSGDIVTVGTRYGVSKLGAAAGRHAGRPISKNGDVTFLVS